MFGLVLAAMLTVNSCFPPFGARFHLHLQPQYADDLQYWICSGTALLRFGQTSGQFLLARMFAEYLYRGKHGRCVDLYRQHFAGYKVTRTASGHLCHAAVGLWIFGFFAGGMLGEIHVYVAIAAQVGTLATCGVLYRLVCKDDTMLPLRG